MGTLKRTEATARVLCHFDSAYYGHPAVSAALSGGADVSVTVRLDPAVKRAITAIAADAWTPIQYTNAVYDEDTETWVPAAEVAEIPFTAFSSRKKSERIPGRLVVQPHPRTEPQSHPRPAGAL